MKSNIFLAGATGAVGRQLVPLLVAGGWRVFGMTRRPERVELLKSLGAEPVVVDVFDGEALRAAAEQSEPRIVVHQLTDLPLGLDPARMAEAGTRNARIRDEGTRNLVRAATAAGATRIIAQSIAFAYADGPLPHRESDPLAIDAEGSRGINARGVAALEQQILNADFAGIVVRFGRLYGPDTGFDSPTGATPLHVRDAARACCAALERAPAGIYNIAEDDGTVDIERARDLFGWVPEHGASGEP